MAKKPEATVVSFITKQNFTMLFKYSLLFLENFYRKTSILDNDFWIKNCKFAHIFSHETLKEPNMNKVSIEIRCPMCGQIYLYDVRSKKSEKSVKPMIFSDATESNMHRVINEQILISFVPCGHIFSVLNKKIVLLSQDHENSVSHSDSVENSHNYINLTQIDLEQILLYLTQSEGVMHAIKFYKVFSGSSLTDAKDKIEFLLKKHGLRKKDGCFIATVCYGDAYAPEVLALKSFRDNTLMKYSAGRIFVKFYYIISPYLSKAIGSSKILREIIRDHVLNYLVAKIKSGE